MPPVRSCSTRLILLALAVGFPFCFCGLNCWGSPFAAPGFVSDRRLFPKGDPAWDGQHKIAFRNADCTYLVGNFRDTGSDAVVILFPAATIHKEWWPNPQIQYHLAVTHNVSSLAVDVAGRGESCGTEVGPGCESTVKDMAAAARFINSLPGRFCVALFGLSSGGKAALFYAAQVSNIPAVFLGEPDDIAILSEFIDHKAGGEVAKQLAKVQEYEVTIPNQADRMIMSAESLRANLAVNVTELAASIPSDTHLYWYTAQEGSSLKSEMRNMSFAHVTNFTHRHFSEARHDFQARQKDEFLRSIAADMAHEAAQATFARAYIKYHRHPFWDAAPQCDAPPHRDSRRRLRRKKEQQKMVPKHFYVDDIHRSDFDRGLVNPAAVQVPSYGWALIVMSYKGCFAQDCPGQMERAFTPPLLARMGEGSVPDPSNITSPVMTAFNGPSWQAATKQLSAHPMGGLRFSSFRPFVYQNELHLSYAIEIFDKSLPLKKSSRSDAHKMRFQGTGFARVNRTTNEMHSLAAFDKPLVPRRELPCCDKNWGVYEHGQDLYIFYTIMPCLTIFRLDNQTDSGASFVYASCLTDTAAEQVSANTGLEMRDMRISGHPVIWSQYPQTLLVLVHHDWRKHGGSKHWAVQLQFDPVRSHYAVVAVSKEPVLDHENYHLHNELVPNVIAVGSYHLSGRRLRILFGDGDKYSAFADVHTDKIRWLPVNDTSAVPWTDGPSVALGDRIKSITYNEYKKLEW